MESAIVETIRSKQIGDPIRVEPVIDFERQNLRPAAPILPFRRRQTFPDSANRYGLLVLDANGRAAENALQGVLREFRILDVGPHALILETCGNEHLCDLGSPFSPSPEVIVALAVESKRFVWDVKRLAPSAVAF